MREEIYDNAKHQARPDDGVVSLHQCLITLCILTEDESATKEETAHHVAITTLNKRENPQTLVGLPTAQDEQDDADEIRD
jgi:hypothetical protein